MAVHRKPITNRAVAALALERDMVYWDRDLPGFGVRVCPGGSKTDAEFTRLGRRSCPRRPVFVAGKIRRPVSNSTSSHWIARTSPMRSPGTAVKRIAAAAAGLRASAASNAVAGAASSDGASTRSRGSSRARSMPRTGLEYCGRQPHRSNCVKSRDAKPSVRLRCTGARGATARRSYPVGPTAPRRP